MKTLCTLVASLVLVGFVGCGDKTRTEAEKATAAAAHSFDQAPAALKDKYQAVAAAIQSNDFPAAKAGLDQLFHAQLSPEQEQALAEQRNQLMVKISTAAQNGDANAAKMIQDLRNQNRSRAR